MTLLAPLHFLPTPMKAVSSMAILLASTAAGPATAAGNRSVSANAEQFASFEIRLRLVNKQPTPAILGQAPSGAHAVPKWLVNWECMILPFVREIFAELEHSSAFERVQRHLS